MRDVALRGSKRGQVPSGQAISNGVSTGGLKVGASVRMERGHLTQFSHVHKQRGSTRGVLLR